MPPSEQHYFTDEIVLTDDDLRRLEERFGPAVRLMGSWNSDGVFGFCSIPMAAITTAADVIQDPEFADSVRQLRRIPHPAPLFIDLFGSAVVDQVLAATQGRFPVGRVRSPRNAAVA
jgi:hypothetical protein